LTTVLDIAKCQCAGPHW